jgi:NAD(P)H-hydrate epimerase
MAVGGTGDTLTGILLALLAAQYPPAEAALIGVYLHSSAADLALEGQSEESWLPSDLIGCLGRAYLELRQ